MGEVVIGGEKGLVMGEVVCDGERWSALGRGGGRGGKNTSVMGRRGCDGESGSVITDDEREMGSMKGRKSS